MLAAEIAFVGYEKYRLERCPASEKTGTYKPPGKIEILLNHKNITKRNTMITIIQKKVQILRAISQRKRNQSIPAST